MAGQRPLPFVVIIICLAATGVVLFFQVQKLSADLGHTNGGATKAHQIHAAASAGDVAAINNAVTTPEAANMPLEGEEFWQEGMTPVMSAAMAAKPDAVRQLIKAGARPDARSRDGKTALIYAAGWADGATVMAVLESKPLINARSDDGWTATTMAATRGTADALAAVINAGGNVSDQNRWGQTALIGAAMSGSAEKVKMILAVASKNLINEADRQGMTALHYAAAGEGPAEVVQMLIDAGANVKALDNDKVTPLMRAADRANVDSVKILLAAGADPNVKDTNGLTALDWAAQRDDDAANQVAAILKAAMAAK